MVWIKILAFGHSSWFQVPVMQLEALKTELLSQGHKLLETLTETDLNRVLYG